jgi:Dyp-type peroxidase family
MLERRDLRDIQGNVLRGYKHLHHVAYLFSAINPQRIIDVRVLLDELADYSSDRTAPPFTIMNAEPWENRDAVEEALNIAFTAQGLERLGWGGRFTRISDFWQGMAQRAGGYLGEDDASLQEWEVGLRGEADILFTLYCRSRDQLKTRVHDLRRRAVQAGLSRVHLQLAGRLDEHLADGDFGHREHFGFRDGFSQPALAFKTYGSAAKRVRGEGVLERPWHGEMRWRPVRVGEFLLGHLDEDDQRPGDRDDKSPHRNGTFMVWRKLEQNVTAFRDYTASTPDDPDEIAAKLVGRWQDGTSLVQAPLASPEVSPGHHPGNAFDYSEDPRGARCPLGAHVRRANPRTSLGWGTDRVRRHRIIRRGMPYDESADGREAKGLVFVCYQASIARQFEQIQGSWMADGDAFELGDERDALLGGGGPGIVRIEGGTGRPLRLLPRPPSPLVTARGGYYLFVPSLHVLRRMARGAGPGAPRAGIATWLLGALGAVSGRRLHHRRRVDD